MNLEMLLLCGFLTQPSAEQLQGLLGSLTLGSLFPVEGYDLPGQRPMLAPTLGQSRAQFGESKRDERVWHYQHSQTLETVILFPSGRSDKRFYVSQMTESKPYSFTLVQQSHRGRTLHNDWFCPLEPLGDPNVVKRPHATILAYLYDRGLKLRVNEPRRSDPIFAKVVGFAAYTWVPVTEVLGYWYIGVDGRETKRSWTSPSAGTARHFPDMTVSYPISEQERAFESEH